MNVINVLYKVVATSCWVDFRKIKKSAHKLTLVWLECCVFINFCELDFPDKFINHWKGRELVSINCF